VFQLHGLFWDAGLRLARAIGRPSVLVVDACQVEEARTWGIRRRGYGGVAERYGEAPQLGAADLVVCVSDEVADQVRRVVGRTDGVVVVPNGVDTHLFAPGAPDPGLRASLGIGEGSFVVGWTGSFRSFHGIDALIEAVARLRERLPNAVLLLVGDGLGRPAVETRARDLGVKAVFTGTVPYPSVPSFLRAMDVTVALAPSRSFHYSPVKIREYQACERPVIAAAAGEMARDFADTALLVEPGDVGSLADALALVHDDPVDAGTRARAGRDSVVEHGSWIARLREVERALGIEERG
jgi:glycosyltransferase involved in cell wall biosynthesis